LPSPSAIVWATSAIDVGTPVPTFSVWPSAPSCVTASAQQRAMSRTSMKSRVCSPSSNTSGGRSFSRREEKIAATPVYGFESDGRPDRVDRRVALDLVHRLPDADRGGEMNDCVDAVEPAPDRLAVAYVAVVQLDVRIEILRPRALRVHLRIEVVERPHLVAV